MIRDVIYFPLKNKDADVIYSLKKTWRAANFSSK